MRSIVRSAMRSVVRSATRSRCTAVGQGYRRAARSVIRCRHKLPVLAVCIPLCRQPLRKLVDSIPPPPNWLGWYGDRARCVLRHEIGGVRHAPNNAAGPATPAFVAGALDWRHRHQSPALVIDHLGDLRRRVVIADAVSSRERLRGYPDPIRDVPVIFRRYVSSGRRSSLHDRTDFCRWRRARRLL